MTERVARRITTPGRTSAGVPRSRATWVSERFGPLTWTAMSVIVLILLWSLVIVVFEPKEYLLPAPWAVLDRLVTSMGSLVADSQPTLYVVFVGYLAGVIVSVPLGILIVASKWVERLAYPLLVGFNAIPKVALAPLFVVWFGYGSTPRIVVTFSIVFFPIVVSTVTGLRSTDPEMLRLVRSMGAKPSRTFLGLRLPNALPSVFSGLKIATSMAVIGAIIGEFVASDEGWGYLLIRAQGELDTTLIFAIAILLAVVATVLYYAVELIERVVMPWHASHRAR